jgi:thiamine biosynthesis lipoprotein ApbE
VGADLADVDALATAAFAMGRSGARWLAAQPDVEAMVIGRDDVVRSTPGFDAYRARSGGASPSSPPSSGRRPLT